MKKIILACMIIGISLTSCIKKYGCTSPNAFNYDSDANKDSGLCEFAADAFAGYYDGTEAIYTKTLTGDTILQNSTRADSFIIYLVDTNRVQLRGFYSCTNLKDSIPCVVVKYEAFLKDTTACTSNWLNFKMNRENDSVIRYTYQKTNASTKDSIIGYAVKR